jgi:hypothetical protein
MEKWFKNLIDKKITKAKKNLQNPINVVDKVLNNPDKYSSRTNKMALEMSKNKGIK